MKKNIKLPSGVLGLFGKDASVVVELDMPAFRLKIDFIIYKED